MVSRAPLGALLVTLLLLPAAQATPPLDWPQRMVGATAAAGLDGEGIVVAVLDSGIDHTHPDLLGTFWSNPADPPNGQDDDRNGLTDDSDGWDFCNKAPLRRVPGFYHGTFVAGVLAGRDGDGGVRGAAPGVRIMDVQVYCDDNDFPEQDDPVLGRDSLRSGLAYAIQHGADVILMSLQGWDDQAPGVVAGLLPADEEFQAAYDAGIVVVGAAGNLGRPRPEQPGDGPHVLTVGATTGCGYRHGFSNHGPGIDLWAPGRAYGPLLGGGHGWDAGTSFAAPLVAGAAALLMQKEPGLGPDEVLRRLVDNAAPSADGPMLDLHGLLGIGRAPGDANLGLVGGTAVGNGHHVQYAWRGDEPTLLDLRTPGTGKWCYNLADPADADDPFVVRPERFDGVEVQARALGPTWAGEWLNKTFTFDRDKEPAASRPVIVPAGDEGSALAPAPWFLAPLALALALAWLRRRD